MKVYTYFDVNKGDYDVSGNGGCYFTSLRKARASARDTMPSGEVVTIRVEEIGNINADLVMTLLNGEGYVLDSTPVATEIGKAESRDDE